VILSEFSIDRLQDVQSLRLVLRVYGTRRHKANLPEPVCLVLSIETQEQRDACERFLQAAHAAGVKGVA
jgi:hypothetical protein